MKHACLLASVLSLTAQAAHGQVFDNHVHLPDGERSLLRYEAEVSASGAEEVGFGGMWFGGPNQAQQGQPARMAANNDQLFALAARHRKMVPIATFHPYDGQAALDELQRVAKLGVRIFKVHPHTQKFDPADARVLALAKRAGELGLIMMMDNGNIIPGDSEKLFNLALQAQGTKFIFAHIGGTNFRFWNTLKMARTAAGLVGDNIYFDISATVTLAAGSPIEDEFIWTLRNVGIDHVLLGSDFPQFTFAQTLAALGKLHLTPKEKAMIAHANARALLGITR